MSGTVGATDRYSGVSKLVFPSSQAAQAGTVLCEPAGGERASGVIDIDESISDVFDSDGCSDHCSITALHEAGREKVRQIRVVDLDAVAGESPVTKVPVGKAAGRGR